jgi:hypothetical protein
MAERISRTIHVVLPGGRTSPDSVARLIEVILSQGLEKGERVESITSALGQMGEAFTMDVVVSVPEDTMGFQQTRGFNVEDERR